MGIRDHMLYFEDDECIFCEGLAIVRYNEKYKGYLTTCDTQWRCS